MAKNNPYVSQASKEVNSMIKSGVTVNENQKIAALKEYAATLSQLDATGRSSQGALAGQQETDDAKMANRLAARGMGGAGGAQFNYGRLDAQQSSDVSALLAAITGQRGALLGAQSKAVGEIDARSAALRAEREAKVGELARLLEDRAKQEAYRQQQMAMERQRLNMEIENNRYAREAADPNSKQNKALEESNFKEQLRQMGEGGDWKSLVPLAAFARQSGRDLNDYYNMIPSSLINAATLRAVGGGGIDYLGGGARQRYLSEVPEPKYDWLSGIRGNNSGSVYNPSTWSPSGYLR